MLVDQCELEAKKETLALDLYHLVKIKAWEKDLWLFWDFDLNLIWIFQVFVGLVDSIPLEPERTNLLLMIQVLLIAHTEDVHAEQWQVHR